MVYTAELRCLGRGCVGLKSFPLQRSQSLTKLLRILTCIECLALPCWECETCSEVSWSADSDLFLEWRVEGWGLLVLASFFQTTQRMQLSWPQVCQFCWQVTRGTVCDPLLLGCLVNDWRLSTVCPSAGVVIVEGHRLPVEGISGALSSHVCDWSNALLLCSLGKTLFVPLW